MDFAAARFKMVENQIRTNKVNDPQLVEALMATPREVFVPKPVRGCAYMDEALEVGNGRYLPEPMILARMLKDAEIKPTDVVLVIGDASGYLTALVSKLAQTVVSLESDSEMVETSSKALAEQGVDNAVVIKGDMEAGLASQAPFDVILLAGSVSRIPDELCRQLADNGRLLAMVNRLRAIGRGTLVHRSGDTFGSRELFDGNLPPLPGFAVKQGFVF